MSEITLLMILASYILLGFACFLLGWDIAETRERKAANRLDLFLREEQRKRMQEERERESITEFVKKNWPNAWEAYRKGVLEGYQAGISNYQQYEKLDDE